MHKHGLSLHRLSLSCSLQPGRARCINMGLLYIDCVCLVVCSREGPDAKMWASLSSVVCSRKGARCINMGLLYIDCVCLVVCCREGPDACINMGRLYIDCVCLVVCSREGPDA